MTSQPSATDRPGLAWRSGSASHTSAAALSGPQCPAARLARHARVLIALADSSGAFSPVAVGVPGTGFESCSATHMATLISFAVACLDLAARARSWNVSIFLSCLNFRPDIEKLALYILSLTVPPPLAVGPLPFPLPLWVIITRRVFGRLRLATLPEQKKQRN